MVSWIVKDRHSVDLEALPGVVGVGRTHGEPCLIIQLSDDEAISRESLPLEVEGIPVISEVVGEYILG